MNDLIDFNFRAEFNNGLGKSQLLVGEETYHIYEDRDLLSKIGYFFHKYLNFCSSWNECSLNINGEKKTFLIREISPQELHGRIASAFFISTNLSFRGKLEELFKVFDNQNRDYTGYNYKHDDNSLNKMQEFVQLALHLTIDGKPIDICDMLLKFYEAVEKKSVATFAKYLLTLGQGKPENDRAILNMYSDFLRLITGANEGSLNQLHILALKRWPLTTEKALENYDQLIQDLRDSTAGMTGTDKEQIERKIDLYQRARQIFVDEELDFYVELFSLKHPENFVYSTDRKPKYFENKFQTWRHLIPFSATGDYFDYQNFSETSKDFATADFSNAYFGGGAFESGDVQEEIQALEFFQFALLLASFPSPISPSRCALSTRNPNDENNFRSRDRACMGSPDPLMLKHMDRVQKIRGYGNEIYTKDIDALCEELNPWNWKHGNITLVGAAGPCIHPQDRFNPEVVKDTFNTIYAEISLQKEKAQDEYNVAFASGRIGAGVFNNDPGISYLLHCLVGEHLDVGLKLYAYDPESQLVQRCELKWKELRQKFIEEKLTLEQCVEEIAKAGQEIANELSRDTV